MDSTCELNPPQKQAGGMSHRTKMVGNGRNQTMDSRERKWQDIEETGVGRRVP